MNATAPGQSSLAGILVPFIALLAVGVVMVASASVALGDGFFNRHIFSLAVAVILAGAVFAVPPGWWDKVYLLGWAVAVLMAIAVLLPGIGTEVNHAQRWIRIGGFSLQPSELAKFGLCVYLAGYIRRHEQSLQEDPKTILIPFGMVCVVGALLVAQPDLGSAVVIVFAAAVLLYLAGARLRYFVLLAIVGVVALAVLIEIAPYRMQRLIAFLDPWSVAFGSGYQLTQALIAFGRGELFGLGLGEGIQKLFYLPEAHNDFIFAVVAEELGAVGAIFIAGVFTYLVFQLFTLGRIHVERYSLFTGYAAYFTGLIIGVQFLVNLGVNTGALPTKGLTLPFVSYGGNSLIVSCAMVALVLRGTMQQPAHSTPGKTRRKTLGKIRKKGRAA